MYSRAIAILVWPHRIAKTQYSVIGETLTSDEDVETAAVDNGFSSSEMS